jgi:bifunctional DNA-binding transcriptional regulator/antitoxin component of YhaV-PrlF toxin-antitoxin module
MKTMTQADTVCFSVKGQVVIPRWLRHAFDIRDGTRAKVQSTPEGILLKPITHGYIRSLRGSLKGRGVMQTLVDDRKRERDL